MPRGCGKPAINHPRPGVAFLSNVNAFGVALFHAPVLCREQIPQTRTLLPHDPLPWLHHPGWQEFGENAVSRPRTRLRQPQQQKGNVNPTSAHHLGHTVGMLMRLLEANCLSLHWLLSNFCPREFCTGFGCGCGFWPRQKLHSPKHRWGR